MMFKLVRLMAAVVVLSALTVGCGASGGTRAEPAATTQDERPTVTKSTKNTRATTTTDATAEDADVSKEDTGSGSSASGESQQQAKEFVAEVKDLDQSLRDFWATAFEGNYTAPVDTLVFFQDDDRYPSCGGDEVSAENAFFCPPDNTVILDADWLFKEYGDIGDSFLYVLLAHEYGHSVQYNLAEKPAQDDQELQADCFSGAFLQSQVDNEMIQVEKGDEQEINQTLASSANEYGDTESHGTLAQRAGAFEYGRTNGVDACLSTSSYI